MWTEALGRILPAFAPVLLGAVVGRTRPLPERATRRMADYLVYGGVPLLVGVSLARTSLGGAERLGLAGVAVATVGGVALLVAAGGRLLGLDRRRYVLPAAVMNCGNLGIAVNRLAFGPAGGEAATLFYVVVALLTFTLGVALVAERSPLRAVLRLPILWAAFAGAALGAAGLAPSRAVGMAAELAALPFLLFLLGHDVAGVRGAAFREGAAVAAVRLSGGALLGTAAALLLLPPGLVRTVAIVESVMPSAVMSFLLARKYGAAPEVAAAAVVLSTLAAPIVIPTAIALASP